MDNRNFVPASWWLNSLYEDLKQSTQIDKYGQKFVYFGTIENNIKAILDNIKKIEEEETNKYRPYKQLLLVEDGSVDLDKLKEEFEVKNPEIKIITYVHGMNKPQLVNVCDKED